jgi:hypothetical protein
MTEYPAVLSEQATLDLLSAGRSIARYGDGEFKLCLGHPCISQAWHPALQNRLRSILRKSGVCLVGIPNLSIKKKPFWNEYRDRRYVDLLADRAYVSAFITRPDSAPAISTPPYWAQVESLWAGRRVTLVRGSDKSLRPENLTAAASVTEIRCLRQHTWSTYSDLLARTIESAPEVAILCCGPTATVLAVDICARGIQALDLGHIGMFMRRRCLSPAAALEEGRREPL